MAARGVDKNIATSSLVNSKLQERFLSASVRNLFFGPLMAAGLAAFLWPHADHRGLVIWVLIVAIMLVPAAIMQFAKPPFRTFYRTSVIIEIFSGLAWASGTIIAMPDEPTAQSILLMLLIGVLMSGASNNSHFLGIFVAFHAPMATLVCVGFIKNTDWPIAPFVGFWVLGFVYVTMAAYEARETQAELVRANLNLESANQLLDVQARTDKLTGLANRLDFTERLEQEVAGWSCDQTAPEDCRPVTLAYLDIDHFKRINDEFGHHAGDLLLQQVAKRLQAASTDSEVVGRLGGDELTVLSSVDPHSLGVRIRSCFDEPFEIERRSLQVGCSVGVAFADGPTTAELLMRDADAALYAAKAAGRGHHRVFSQSLRLQSERRVSLQSELHSALVNGDIVPWLQPVVDLLTGEIVAAEALARWEHPDGVRTAASFIELLSEIGMMGEFTEQLLHAVAEFQASLVERGIPMVPISINVPSSHLSMVANTATRSPLVIEITEQTAIADLDDTRYQLRAARAEGHRVWLDDFGTGFSSMSVIADLPVDGLKIDRDFVARLMSSTAVNGVVAAMVELADRLEVDVVAEGVEHRDQAQILRDFGITMAQGHLWSPAVPFAEFAEWLQSGRRFVSHNEALDITPGGV